MQQPKVNALLLTDQLFQDIGSKKFVLSGVFHQINVPELPFVLQKTLGVFASVYGLKGKSVIQLRILDDIENMVLIETTEMEITSEEENDSLDFGIEFPPFEIFHSGYHYLELIINGVVESRTPIHIYKI